MTETSHLTAQEMADRIVELEGQVMALRKASAWLLEEMDMEASLAMKRALTDTAQAGREAEARIKAEGAELVGRSIQESTNNDIPVYRNGLLVAAKIAAEEANRLRNGGSDNG